MSIAQPNDPRLNRLWHVTLIVLVGLIAALYFHYSNGYYNHMSQYSRNTFLFSPDDVGNDFYNIFRAVKDGHPYYSHLFVYFPFTYLAVLPFTFIRESYACAIFLLIFSIFTAIFVYLRLDFLDKKPRYLVVSVLVFLSYPFLFCLDRANVECEIFVFLVCFVLSFINGKRWQSVLWLVAATAMTVYPGVFLILYLAVGKIREAIWAVIFTILLSIVSLNMISGDINENIALLVANLNGFRNAYVLGGNGVGFGSTLFSPLKLALSKMNLFNAHEAFILKAYSIFCLVFFGMISLFIVFRETTLWKRVALLTFVMILFPYVSFDYKLIHLFLPLTLFLSEPKKSKRDSWYATLFGLLFIPKAYAWIGRSDINWGVFLNPILMLFLIGLIFWENLEDHLNANKQVIQVI